MPPFPKPPKRAIILVIAAVLAILIIAAFVADVVALAVAGKL